MIGGELRCENKKHAVVDSSGAIDISCNSRFCGASKEVLVIHRFKITTKELVETYRFKKMILGEK